MAKQPIRVVVLVAVVALGGAACGKSESGAQKQSRAQKQSSAQPHGGLASSDPHTEYFDHLGAMERAMTAAPEGETPCDTAYLGFLAIGDELTRRNLPTPWKAFPDRATFTAACATLAEQEQLCLGVRYQKNNQQACAPIIDRLRRRDTDKLFYLFGFTAIIDAGPAAIP